jgi:hypothetical protein
LRSNVVAAARQRIVIVRPTGSHQMLFMVIERFKDRDPAPIYARLRADGRALPEGLRYVESWVEANFDRCFQLMEADDTAALQRWILQWRDLVEFEVVPISPSQTVRELVTADPARRVGS